METQEAVEAGRDTRIGGVSREEVRKWYAVMGIPVVLALVLYVVNLARTMRGRPASAPEARRPAPAAFASTLPVR